MYDLIINSLMNNDKNGSWDEILDEVENDQQQANKEVYKALRQIIDEEEYKGEELLFYTIQLERIKELLVSKIN